MRTTTTHKALIQKTSRAGLNDATLDVFEVPARGFETGGAVWHLRTIALHFPLASGLRSLVFGNRTPLLSTGPESGALVARFRIQTAGVEVERPARTGGRGGLHASFTASARTRRWLGGGGIRFTPDLLVAAKLGVAGLVDNAKRNSFS